MIIVVISVCLCVLVGTNMNMYAHVPTSFLARMNTATFSFTSLSERGLINVCLWNSQVGKNMSFSEYSVSSIKV